MRVVCECVGRRSREGSCQCDGEEFGGGASLELGVKTEAPSTSGVQVAESTELPGFGSLLPPGEVLLQDRTLPRTVRFEAVVSQRPVGPVHFTRQGLGQVSAWVDVAEVEPPLRGGPPCLVDMAGRKFCGLRGCLKPWGHTNRCGKWAICAECGVDYGVPHPGCPVSGAGPPVKPPWMCSRTQFCRLPMSHSGVHKWTTKRALEEGGFSLAGYEALFQDVSRRVSQPLWPSDEHSR